MEPGIEELRNSMPKAIAIPSHDWGVEGMPIHQEFLGMRKVD